MQLTIITGMIEADSLYYSIGSITYNSVTYTNQNFRGVSDITTFVGTGSVINVIEFRGGTVLFMQSPNEGYKFPDSPTNIVGATINLQQDSQDKKFNEVTKIQGMSVALVDFPFYLFDIMEQRG